MRALRAAVILLASAMVVFGAYTYYYSDTFPSIDSTKWYVNGSLFVANGIGWNNVGGGSLISKLAVPDGTSDYEVKMTLSLPYHNATGSFVTFLRASSDAMSGPSPAGTFYSVELRSLWGSGTECGGGLVVNKRVGGVLTQMASLGVSCHDGMVFRSIVRQNQILVFSDNVNVLALTDSSITSGQPGVGTYGANLGDTISRVDLGILDRVAPGAPSAGSVTNSTLPRRVDLQFASTVDDANGVGVWRYPIQRNDGVWFYPTTTTFTDASALPSTNYTYTLYAQDYHLNLSAGTPIALSTPAFDPQQTGVRPVGTYWGAAGEQIDVASGNVNFTLPLFSASLRSKTVTFALSYNSQVWRKNASGTTLLGDDVGYGFGWRLMAGSIIPVYNGVFTLMYYLFTDATGAQYSLDINNAGVWTSRDNIYLWYDSNTNLLRFKDGSSWLMGSVSGSAEQDAGTRYPTVVTDSNGNFTNIHYYAGIGQGTANTSARIQEIEDVRAVVGGPFSYHSYAFTYNTDAIPHLTSITNYLGNGSQKFTLAYQASQPLNSPFPGGTSFGTTTLLASVAVTTLGFAHSFIYDPGGSGELTQVNTPGLGHLRWAYRNFTYSGGLMLREVQNRYLSKASGAAETTYPFVHDDAGDASRLRHAWTQLDDPGGVGSRLWNL